MSLASVTYIELIKLVAMDQIDPANYKAKLPVPQNSPNSNSQRKSQKHEQEVQELDPLAKKEAKIYEQFKQKLSDHLQGDQGQSLLQLVACPSEQDIDSFKPENLKLGFTASCPVTLRVEIIAQHDYRASEYRRINELPPQNEDSIRVKNLVAAILGVPLTLAFRIARLVLRTVFLPLTFIYAFHQQSRYKLPGWAKEDVRRIGWEWIDTGVTFLTFFIGLINMFHPNAIKLDSLRDYYIKRHDYTIKVNQGFAAHKKKYLSDRIKIRNAMAMD